MRFRCGSRTAVTRADGHFVHSEGTFQSQASSTAREAGVDFGAEVPLQMTRELRFIIRFLRRAVPRQLFAGDTRPPLTIFTGTC